MELTECANLAIRLVSLALVLMRTAQRVSRISSWTTCLMRACSLRNAPTLPMRMTLPADACLVMTRAVNAVVLWPASARRALLALFW